MRFPTGQGARLAHVLREFRMRDDKRSAGTEHEAEAIDSMRRSRSARDTSGSSRDRESLSPSMLAKLEAEFGTARRLAGIRAALALLNARTRFRFTGVYRLDPPLLRNVYLYDRENPSLNVSGDINTLRETYCSIVAESSGPFDTEDATRDSRLVDHPARSTVVSYLGVPIRGADGRVWGTLCHFDSRRRLIPLEEVPVLEWVARSLTNSLDDLDTTPGSERR
jgi:GAF domain-containing protein